MLRAMYLSREEIMLKLLRDCKSEPRLFGGDQQILTSIQLVRDGRVANASDRCVPERRAVARPERERVAHDIS